MTSLDVYEIVENVAESMIKADRVCAGIVTEMQNRICDAVCAFSTSDYDEEFDDELD